ncbi:MAG: 50S ribosomal protein L19e [Nitrososphaerota archaeon]|nr:50S ribosomal protein L19e [Nitrososphaerota archaeon]MDG6968562.1 50S ribosomal protein L19e [Nitrososphaerota archaeon]MDG6974555.1 50S ribosomal protein L19e [Nitrososphaerota archaeon]MDG7009435.1 50S ribosomal protein L19e [Nitrososphaerota archaeon]MDG7015850.1 50S ribosomal protein L19e [Nitrososphaerota archaeon]
MNLKSKRRLAASVLGVGVDRIRFNDEYSDLIQDAITRSTIRGLAGFGAITVAPVKGVSRGRFRSKSEKLKRGRGAGSTEGSATARNPRKDMWISKVRALRWRLKVAKDRKEITPETYRALYKQVKGGQVRGVKHLLDLMKEAKR